VTVFLAATAAFLFVAALFVAALFLTATAAFSRRRRVLAPPGSRFMAAGRTTGVHNINGF
jgi:hypothetical protein